MQSQSHLSNVQHLSRCGLEQRGVSVGAEPSKGPLDYASWKEKMARSALFLQTWWKPALQLGVARLFFIVVPA